VRSDRRLLHTDSTVADLPVHHFRVRGSVLGERILAELECQPELPGVIVDVDQGEGPGPATIVSRGTFFQLLSKGFGREIFLRRPIQILQQANAKPPLSIPSATPITEAAAAALSRPLAETYEPILLEGPDGGLSMLDVHDLLLAQSQLLTLSNRLVAQKVDALEAANRALRETQTALVQSEKMAGLGQLAAGVAHEINNPIAFVANNLAILQREMKDVCGLVAEYRKRLSQSDPGGAEALRQVEEEMDLDFVEKNRTRQFQASLEGLRRVTDIVRNLSDFARLNHAERKEFDLNAALHNTLEMLVFEKKKRMIDFVTSFGDVPPIDGYPGKINQVLLNIILNAMQACQRNGRVEIATFVATEAACVEVRDNGCGIAPEHRARLFDPFFTTKPVGEGTGLGLSISFGIIREHGGAIEVESTLGAGSTFRIRLPLSGVFSHESHEIHEKNKIPRKETSERF
jgi:signal transduction histidine kinase